MYHRKARTWCNLHVLCMVRAHPLKHTMGEQNNKRGQVAQQTDTIVNLGHTPSTAGTFRKKFRKNSGKTPETLSERFLEFLSRVRLGCPKPYNSRHLRFPEHFQNYLPPSTAGGASSFRSGSGEGLPEPVMEFPAVLGVFLRIIHLHIAIQKIRHAPDPNSTHTLFPPPLIHDRPQPHAPQSTTP